jgi:AraC-like DNA-binding protein
VSDLHVPWAMSAPVHERFDATVRYRKLDKLVVAEYRGCGFTGRRSGSQTGHEHLVGVLMNLTGRLVCRYSGGAETVLEPGKLLVWDTGTAEGFDAMEPHRELYLLLPRERVPQGLADAAARGAGAVAAGPGAGLAAIAADQLRAITRELDQLSDAALTIACQSFFDPLDAALAPVAAPVTGVRAHLVAKVRQYIEAHLDDPELCASSIASAHGVSVRTLQVASADTGTTVGRWIRDRRLKVCYRELAQPGSARTVTDIAFRWGFNDVAHFSRAFKQAFGVTPSSILAMREAAIAG